MRVFLDENVDPRLADRLVGHEVDSVRTKGWFGVSNGELLQRIESEFDVLISHDRGLEHKQNWSRSGLALIVIESPNTALASYVDRPADIAAALVAFQPGVVARVAM